MPTEQWIATLDGAPHLEWRFKMDAGSSDGQARYVIVEMCSWARSAAWTPERPEARIGLVVAKVAAELVEWAEAAE